MNMHRVIAEVEKDVRTHIFSVGYSERIYAVSPVVSMVRGVVNSTVDDSSYIALYEELAP